MALVNYAAITAIVLSNLPTGAMSSMTFTSMTKEALILNFISPDGDVSFRNIDASTHYDKCTRYYTGGHSMGYAWLNDDNATLTDVHLLPDEGIMLSSGNPLDFESNDSDQETTRWFTSEDTLYDAELAHAINNDAVYDACYIEFEFKCTSDAYIPQVSFKYMFGSEEYYEYVNSPYNDAFALLLNGVNIARLPSTESDSDIVAINNVNYHLNTQYFHGNDPGTGDLADPIHNDLGMIYPQMEPDGFTIILTAHGAPYQNSDEWNKIKIVVGDVGDGILDSWVLLESGTFSCVDITEAPSVSRQPSDAPTLKPTESKAPSFAPSSLPTLSVAPSTAPSLAPTISQAPSNLPSMSPSVSKQPSGEPTSSPSSSRSPSAKPSAAPSASQMPSSQPSTSPSTSEQPSDEPTSSPSLSKSPSMSPSDAPSVSQAPSSQPSAPPSTSTQPSDEPTSSPSLSKSPSASPSDAPSVSQAPSNQPSASPSTSEPTSSPSLSKSPSANPSDAPSVSQSPSSKPSASPSTSTQPSDEPTSSPSLSTSPSASPSDAPSASQAPSSQPSTSPSTSKQPSVEPTSSPSLSKSPSASPSDAPSVSQAPSNQPTATPSTSEPTSFPSLSKSPSVSPSDAPSVSQEPSSKPSTSPSISKQPSDEPTLSPSLSTSPSASPSDAPSVSQVPSSKPSTSPSTSKQPSAEPTSNPSLSSHPSSAPSISPSSSSEPSSAPSLAPSTAPSLHPTVAHSGQPSLNPSTSSAPSILPSSVPSLSTAPQGMPSILPTLSVMPSSLPSFLPTSSTSPSSLPSVYPTISTMPSSVPSLNPTISTSPSSQPTSMPSTSQQPSNEPSAVPSLSSSPSSVPSFEPSVSKEPTGGPTQSPTISKSPSTEPTSLPSTSQQPTKTPSLAPSLSSSPSSAPSFEPSVSKEPTGGPTQSPTVSSSPSAEPTLMPSTSQQPSNEPSLVPSLSSRPSSAPSVKPTSSPSQTPTTSPSLTLSVAPSESLSPSALPSNSPSSSSKPSFLPSTSPSKSSEPSSHPSLAPSTSSQPSSNPSLTPSKSSSPTSEPSLSPSVSSQPTSEPSSSPSNSAQPSVSPTDDTEMPSVSTEPSLSPTKSPVASPSTSPSISHIPTKQPSSAPSSSTQPTLSPSTSPSVSVQPSSTPTSLSSVGPNTVFNDLDADGIQDENEPGLANITIILYNATDDTPVATTETDENGIYEFSDVVPGAYFVSVLNTTYYFSPVQEGGNQVTANEDGPNGSTPTVEVSNGEVVDNWNVGLFEPVTVGNRVWLDYNADGYHDEDEPGMANVTIILVDQSGNPVEGQVQVSDSEGYYLFTGLPPSTYGVEFVVPEDYNFSPPSPLSDAIDRSDPNAGDFAADIDSSGMATPVELQSGSTDLTVDAGVYIPVDIGGSIFLDLNADGIRDSGETDGVEGVTLILYDTINGVSVGEVVTLSDGSYVFPLMPPGTYHVKLLTPSGEYVVSPLADGGNSFDSSYDPAMTESVTIISGFDAGSLFDGGLYQGVRTSLYVWNDANGNGIQDEGEGPYTSEATVNIYDPNSSSPSTPIASGTVASDGSFTHDILPGNYTVEVVLNDINAVFSLQDQGSDDTIDSDVDTSGMASITAVSGEQINISAGVTTMPQVSSCAFLDVNGNGLQEDDEPPLSGVEIELYHANGTLAAVTTSDENCLYGFVAPDAGDYYVTVVTPESYELSPVVDGGNQIFTNEDGSNNSPVVSLTFGAVEDSWNVGMYLPVSIGNRVWNDLNGNGIQNEGEPGIEGITVHLNDGGGVAVATTATDNTGHYLFEGMSPGNYSVAFELPDSFVFTIPAKITADIVDPVDGSYAYDDVTSDVNRDTGATEVFMISSGSTNLSLDAGMFIPVSINGTTWHDLDADGFQNEGEPNLEGSTIILFDAEGDIIFGTTPQVVGPSGVWNFEGLPPGTYTAQILPPSGEWYLSPIPEQVGNSTSTDFDPANSKTNPVTLQSGEAGEGSFDAGFYMPASVGDRVWFDEQPNGIQDFGEPPMDSPVAIKLYDSLGYLKGETTTSAGGFYQFTGLRPGTYEVEFILPSEDFNFAILKAGDDNALDSDANPKTGRAQVTLQSGEINDDIDAGIMDASPYYPDWTNDIQVCTNDGFDPLWLEIQKDNYLYSSKEECCKTHFWWRMTQCMANEEFKFYKFEDRCDTKVVFEDWESNTPDMFLGGETTLFDTLDECCANHFWYDLDGCMTRSPVIFKFEFCVDIGGLVEPIDCQSADIYGTVLEHAINTSADIGLGEIDTSVTKIGEASLEKDTGTTVCGGSLAGQSFTNELTGSNPDIDSAVGTTTEVCGFLTVEAADDCKEEECLTQQYNDISQSLKDASTTGSLTNAIKEKATTRLPPEPALQDVIAANFTAFDVLMPATITGDFETQFFFGTDLTTCQEKPTLAFRETELRYDTLHLCCQQHFNWDVSGCCINGGGCIELQQDSDSTSGGYYPTWVQGELCAYKTNFESWEEKYDTIEDCCTAKFGYDYNNCMNSA